MTYWIPAVLAITAAIAWFMSMVAGAWLDSERHNTLTARMWYGCSIFAVEFVVIFAWMIGRVVPWPGP